MYKITLRYIIYSLGILSVRKSLKREKKKASLQIPSFRGVIEVKSAINGRIRFKAPTLKNNKEGFVELKKQLERISSIKTVETNYITGSLLITYEEDIKPTLIVGVIIKLLGLEEEVKGGTSSLVTKESQGLKESLNLAIDEKTKGLLDLRSLVFSLPAPRSDNTWGQI